MAEPILKWAGGKRELLPEITARAPSAFGRYHEPFLGGGAVFFHLEPSNGSVNDVNPRLARFYRVVRDHPEALVEESRTHEHDEAYYYDARDAFNDLRRVESPSRDGRVREASLLLYLNRTGFNGLYRENADGEFNVPVGRYANPDWVQADRVRAASRVLSGIDVTCGDFASVVDVATAGDFVYLDPPYQPVSATADFTSYSAEGFDRDDQRRLRDVAVELDESGVHVVLSNSPPVAELYEPRDAFDVGYVDASRAINSDADGRGDVAELLVTNVPAGGRRRSTLSEFS